MSKGTKKAVSEIMSYVLLISITVAVGASMFFWLKGFVNLAPPPDCDDGSSIIVTNIDKQTGYLTLEILNNGYFNISGFILRVGENDQRQPIDNLMPFSGSGLIGNEYTYFERPLGPGESINASFLPKYGDGRDADIERLIVMEIQPFILFKEKTRVVCSQAIIRQNI